MITLYELCSRDVISVPSGVRFGRIGDVRIDETTAQITHIIICGKGRFFGLFGRKKDISLPWGAITAIGRDVILVTSTEEPMPEQEKPKGFSLFGN